MTQVHTESSSSEISKKLTDEYEKLKQRRDEIRVKSNLGKREVQAAWSELDVKWHELERKMKQVGAEAEEASKDVATAARSLIGEIREGFTRIGRAA
jgi:hypothetical protein